MKDIYSWNDIINDDKIESIFLVGYGSLLNKETHHSEKKNLTPVKVKGFKREFTLTYNSDRCNSPIYNKRFEKSALHLREEYNLEDNKLKYIENSGSLNVRLEENSEMNGLLLEVERKEYKKR